MIIAESERTVIRNWRPDDLDLFWLINSDETVMEFFPARRNREESKAMMDRLTQMIETTGYGFFALERKSDNVTMGFMGLALTDLEPALPKGLPEVGWRLAPQYWGSGYATEAAERLLELGFGERGLAEIVSFAVQGNTRSTAVMERLGMVHDLARDFDHPRIPDTHPQLKRHVLYSMTADLWQRRRDNR